MKKVGASFEDFRMAAEDLLERGILAGFEQLKEFGFDAAFVAEAGIEIDGLDPSVVPDSVIAELRDSPVLFGAPQKSPVSDVWTVRALGEWGTEDLSGRTLDLTFMTPEGPYAAAFVIATVK